MSTLDKRIAELEKRTTTKSAVDVIMLVPLGEKEVNEIHDNHGNQWHRLPSESQDEFKARAESEVPREIGEKQRISMMFAR